MIIDYEIKEKSQPQTEVISLLEDSTDDEMEVKKQRRSTSTSTQKRGRYTSKGRQYNSRRSGGPNDIDGNTSNNSQRRRRSRRLQNKNGNNGHETIQQPNPIQNPIIINGVDDDLNGNYDDDIMEVHGSQSPAFMPSANYNQQQGHNKYASDDNSSNHSMPYPQSMHMSISTVTNYNYTMSNH